MNKILVVTSLAVFFCISITTINGQKRSEIGKVCGDPTARCRTRKSFQPNELPFDFGPDNAVIAESRPFYAVILKSTKVKPDQSDCSGKFPEVDRNSAQALFPHNMVFVMRCNESMQNYYTNVANNVSFMAIFAGNTLSEANLFLKKVKA